MKSSNNSAGRISRRMALTNGSGEYIFTHIKSYNAVKVRGATPEDTKSVRFRVFFTKDYGSDLSQTPFSVEDLIKAVALVDHTLCPYIVGVNILHSDVDLRYPPTQFEDGSYRELWLLSIVVKAPEAIASRTLNFTAGIAPDTVMAQSAPTQFAITADLVASVLGTDEEAIVAKYGSVLRTRGENGPTPLRNRVQTKRRKAASSSSLANVKIANGDGDSYTIGESVAAKRREAAKALNIDDPIEEEAEIGPQVPKDDSGLNQN